MSVGNYLIEGYEGSYQDRLYAWLAERTVGPGTLDDRLREWLAARGGVGAVQDMLAAEKAAAGMASDVQDVAWILTQLAGSVAYLLRWYGASAADQSIVHAQVLDSVAEGMLDGQMTATVIDIGVLSVTSNKLRGLNNAAYVESDLIAFAEGDCVMWRLASPFVIYAVFGVMSSYTDIAAALIGQRADHQTGVAGTFVGNTSAYLWSVPPSDNAMVIGGFNVSGEPVGGAYGVFAFEKRGGSWAMLHCGHNASISLTKRVVAAAYSGAAPPEFNLEYVARPDADFSSLLVPIVMDTFTGANGTALNGKAVEVGGETWAAENIELQGGRAQSMAAVHQRGWVECGESDVVVSGELYYGSATPPQRATGLIFRVVDMNDHWWADIYNGAIRLGENVGGVQFVRATVAITSVNGQRMVVTTDGDKLTAAWGASAGTSFVSSAKQTATKHGIQCWESTAPNQSEVDNFAVYLRRSSAYDDALEPYRAGIATAPASN